MYYFFEKKLNEIKEKHKQNADNETVELINRLFLSRYNGEYVMTICHFKELSDNNEDKEEERIINKISKHFLTKSCGYYYESEGAIRGRWRSWKTDYYNYNSNFIVQKNICFPVRDFVRGYSDLELFFSKTKYERFWLDVDVNTVELDKYILADNKIRVFSDFLDDYVEFLDDHITEEREKIINKYDNEIQNALDFLDKFDYEFYSDEDICISNGKIYFVMDDILQNPYYSDVYKESGKINLGDLMYKEDDEAKIRLMLKTGGERKDKLITLFPKMEALYNKFLCENKFNRREIEYELHNCEVGYDIDVKYGTNEIKNFWENVELDVEVIINKVDEISSIIINSCQEKFDIIKTKAPLLKDLDLSNYAYIDMCFENNSYVKINWSRVIDALND